MKLRVLVPTLAALLALGACSKEKKKKETEATTPGEVTDEAKKLLSDDVPAPGDSAPAPDTAKTNELWSLAPAGTVFGIVAQPGAGTELHSMMMTVMATAKARPLGAKLIAELEEEAKDGPFNPLDPASIKATGIDLSGPVALFMVQKKEGYVVLPVADRAAFRKTLEGTLETIDGLEVDKLDDDFFCVDRESRYLCASSIEHLKAFGPKVGGPLAKKVADLPAEYRGHAEFVMDVAGMKKVDDDFDTDFDGQFSDPKLGIASLRFGNGAVTARGWFQVKALDKMAAAVTVPNSLSSSLASSKPSSIFSFRMPVPLLAEEMPSDGEQIAGIDMKNDIIGNLTGEIVGYTPQSEGLWGRLAFGLRDATPFKTLLNMGCGMAPAAGIPGLTVTPEDGKCTALVDVSKLPLPDPTVAQMFEEPVKIVAEAKADRFEITFGKETPLTNKPVSPMGVELMEKKWNFSMWAEGMGLASGPAIPWNQMPAAVPADVIDGVKMAVWMLSHVYEVGMAGAIRADGIHGMLHIATYAGDAPETFKAYQAAVSTTLSSGQATKEFAAIREKWPKSMAARGGTGAGSMMIAGVGGMLAAIAVPAFMKYQQKSMEAMEMMEAREREMEAQMQALDSQ